MNNLYKYKTLSMILSAGLLSGVVSANDTSTLNLFVQAEKRIPVEGLSMIRSGDRLVFKSLDGRFVIAGKAYDNKQNKFIKSFSDIEERPDVINFKKLGIDIAEDLEPIVIGKGKKIITIFSDPFCSECHDLIEKISELDNAIKKKYTFNVVLMPFLDAANETAVKALRCINKEKGGDIAFDILLDQEWDDIPETKQSSCGVKGMTNAQLFSKIVGITGVPFVVDDKGFKHIGRVSSWLVGE